MKRWLDLYALVVALFLGVGYVASQYAYFHGNPSGLAAQLDQPTIRMLATLVLVIAIGWLFFDRTEAPE